MIKQRNVLALVGLALITGTAAYAGHPKPQPKSAPTPVIVLSEQDKQHLLQDIFTVVKNVRETPEPVRKQLIPDGKEVLSGMADPGQAFQTTDVVGPKPLPFRRLIFAATSPGYCLVYYEFGGYASGQRVDLFRLFGGQADHVWSGSLTGTRQSLTLPGLRAEISRGKYYSLR